MTEVIWTKLTTINFTELGLVLCGQHNSYPFDWMKVNWVQSRSGFKLNKSVKMDKTGRRNPRISGSINFYPLPQFKGKYLASEVLECPGGEKCKQPCGVKLKIQYAKDMKNVDLFFTTTFHGELFLPQLQIKVPIFIKQVIIQNDKQTASLGKYGTTPTSEFLILSLENAQHQISPVTCLLPTTKQIENILYYSRRKCTNKNDGETTRLIKFVQECENVIYPPKNFHQFADPIVIVMKFNKVTMDMFVKSTNCDNSIIGMDSQYCNNSYRCPITILCTQTTEKVTVPGFVGFFSKSTEEAYYLFIQNIQKYLKEHHGYKLKGSAMIDKCAAERAALTRCGFKVLLCEFHIVRIFEATIRKNFKNNTAAVECLRAIKKIQRADDLIEFEDACTALDSFCKR